MKYKYRLEFRSRQLRAMNILLNHYNKVIEDGHAELAYCPLCKISEGCNWCVWLKEEQNCSDYFGEHRNDSSIKGADVCTDLSAARVRNSGWAKHRIRQLTEWIAKYEELK